MTAPAVVVDVKVWVLIEALAARREELGMSQFELDKRAGLVAGYTWKLEAWHGRRGRALGLLTLPRLLEALGVALAVVPVDE